MRSAYDDEIKPEGITCPAKIEDEEKRATKAFPYGSPKRPVFNENALALSTNCPFAKLGPVEEVLDKVLETYDSRYLYHISKILEDFCSFATSGLSEVDGSLELIKTAENEYELEAKGPCFSCLSLCYELKDLEKTLKERFDSDFQVNLKTDPVTKKKFKKEIDSHAIALKTMQLGVNKTPVFSDLVIPDGPFFFAGIDEDENIHIIIRKGFRRKKTGQSWKRFSNRFS